MTKEYKPLDEFEKDLSEAFDSTSDYERPEDYKMLLSDAVIAANNTSSRSKAISIRVSEKDLIKLKGKADEIGMPYQTLINTLLHQYVKGDIHINLV